MEIEDVLQKKGKDWVSVSPEELPKRTVHGTEERFRCSYCRKFLTYAYGEKNRPHFRHRHRGEDDECEKRKKAASKYSRIVPNSLPLPLRLKVLGTRFRLSVGFPPLGRDFLERNAGLSIEIRPNGQRGRFNPRYRLERLFPNRWTYLKLDGKAEWYELVLPAQLQSEARWKRYSTEVRMLPKREPAGRLFSDRGRSLPFGADVQCGRTYLLLTRRGERLPEHHPDSLEIHSCCLADTWQIWKVRATRFKESVAMFFNEYGFSLRHHAIRTVTLWPACFQGGEQIYKAPDSELVVFLQRDSNSSEHDAGSSVQLRHEGGEVRPFFRRYPPRLAYEVFRIPANVEHLDFYHNSTTLENRDIQNHPLDLRGTVPTLEVTDFYGEPIFSGVTDCLPKDGLVRIRAGGRGFAELWEGAVCLKRLRFNGSEYCNMEGLTPGRTLRVWIGLDEVWTLTIPALELPSERIHTLPRRDFRQEETALLSRFRTRTGHRCRIPLEAGTLACRLREFPKLHAWLLECARTGWIDEHAWKTLKSFVKKEVRNENE